MKIIKKELIPTQALKELNIVNPIVIGLIFTGFNPHFLIWWCSIGLLLIAQVLELGLAKTFWIMYITHMSTDAFWLTFLAYISGKGLKVLGRKYGYVLIALSIILITLCLYILVSIL